MSSRTERFPFHSTRIHGPQRHARPGGPTVFWPAIIVMVSFGVVLICWGAYEALARQANSEKALQVAPTSPKFKETQDPVETPELLPEPEPLFVAQATAEPPLLPPAPAPVDLPAPKPMQPPLVQFPPVELPKVVPPKEEFKIELPPAPPLPLTPPPVPEPVAPPVVPKPLVAVPPPPLVMEPPLPAPEVEELPMPAVVMGAPEPLVAVQHQALEFPGTQPLVYSDAVLGDTPMLRNWKTLALCSFMTSALFVQTPPPVLAQDKTAEAIDSLKQTFEQSFKAVRSDVQAINLQLQTFKEDLKKIQEDAFDQRLKVSNAVLKMQEVEKSLAKIREDLDELKSKVAAGTGVKAAGVDKSSMDEIKSKLGAIEQAILKLQPSTTSQRIALSPPTPSGKVLLVNLYPQELLFVVNNKAYRVGANSSLTVDNVPAGTVTYELISDLWGSRGRNSTTLTANETLTLTAR